METMEDNRLIAEFMGLTNHHDDSSIMVAKTPQGNEVVPIDSLKYHASWDWLMPVVQKIESLGYVFTIQGGKAEYSEMISKPKIFIAKSKMSSTYKAVVQFIKEYKTI
tara:strand:- start:1122 stop:1445 length:324 start_codon:yes stop_codon:yes gene_type:complete